MDPEKPTSSPIGNDAAAATPDGVALTQALHHARTAREQGYSSVSSEKKIELLKAQVEAEVKQQLASGATNAQVEQAAAKLAGGDPILTAVARAIAKQQMDTEKFNLFSTRGLAVNDAGANGVPPEGGFTPAAVNDVRPAILKALTGIAIS